MQSSEPTFTSQDIHVRSALARGTEFLRSLGIEAARLEMELILAELMGVDRLHLYMKMDQMLTTDQRERSRAMLARRRDREPLAYILGHREFYGLRFEVSRAVLIPRPETELLVDRVVAWLRAWNRARGEPLLADIGTGSGAIAVAAAHTQKAAGLPGRWIATDLSESALAVARANAERHAVADRIDFRHGSFIAPLPGPVDCLCSNPPYVAEADRASLAPEIAKWEPREALFSGPDGMEHLREIITQAPNSLNPGGAILLEIGFGQQEAVDRILQGEAGLDRITFHSDFAGIPRVAEAHLKKSMKSEV